MKTVQYPMQRYQLVRYLQSLSDIEYQRSCWVEGRCPDGVVHDEFDYSVHFLYDDTVLAENPESTIGEILLNEAEAAAIRDVIKSLEAVFDEHGLDLSDAEYIGTREWPEVLKTSKHALDLIKTA